MIVFIIFFCINYKIEYYIVKLVTRTNEQTNKRTNKMNTLPIDIVNIILEYQGYHIFRHGKYMKRLRISDERYSILNNMRRIKRNNYGTYEVCFWKSIISTKRVTHRKIDTCFMIETHVLPSSVMWVMNVSYYYDDNDSYDDRYRIQFILN
jgi:hypothetical protein